MPVHKAEHQALDIGIAREQLGFDGRNLALAPLDFYSRRYSRAFQFNVGERSAISIEHG